MDQTKIKKNFMEAMERGQKSCNRYLCDYPYCFNNLDEETRNSKQKLGAILIPFAKNGKIQEFNVCKTLVTLEEIYQSAENAIQQQNYDNFNNTFENFMKNNDFIQQFFKEDLIKDIQQQKIKEIQSQIAKQNKMDIEQEQQQEQTKNNNKMDVEQENNPNKLEEEEQEQVQQEEEEEKKQDNNEKKQEQVLDLINIGQKQRSLLDLEKVERFFAKLTQNENTQISEISNKIFSKQINDQIDKVILKYLKKVLDYKDIKQYQLIEENYIGLVLCYPQLFEKDELFEGLFYNFDQLHNKYIEHLSQVLRGVLNQQKTLDLVQDLKNQIIGRYYSLADSDDEQYAMMIISGACKLVKLIYMFNMDINYVELQEFCCEFEEDQIDIRQEYQTFIDNERNKTHNFSFVDYGFLLDVNFKQQIFELENYVNQKRTQNRTIHQSIFQGIFNPNQLQLRIVVRRNNILHDTLNQIQQNLNWKLKLQVVFEGEQGIDEGGVQKEFFILLVKELFNLDYGMFVPKQNNTFHWFNGDDNETMPVQYELVGIILGLAIYNNVLLDIKFPQVVYKKLLKKDVSIYDLKEFDKTLFDSLMHIKNYEGNDLEDSMITFQVKYHQFYVDQVHNLKENGDQILVNQENKHEYINLYVNWYLNKHIERQFRAFQKGFDKVTEGSDFLRFIMPVELQQIIIGCENYDFQELKKSTKYADGYSPNNQVVQWFWEILLNEFELKQQRRFLFFMSGSDRAPVQGLKNIKMIIVRQAGDTEKLPSASTCFNHLFLPEYASRDKLKDKLMKAMENAEGFGLL